MTKFYDGKKILTISMIDGNTDIEYDTDDDGNVILPNTSVDYTIEDM